MRVGTCWTRLPVATPGVRTLWAGGRRASGRKGTTTTPAIGGGSGAGVRRETTATFAFSFADRITTERNDDERRPSVLRWCTAFTAPAAGANSARGPTNKLPCGAGGGRRRVLLVGVVLFVSPSSSPSTPSPSTSYDHRAGSRSRFSPPPAPPPPRRRRRWCAPREPRRFSRSGSYVHRCSRGTRTFAVCVSLCGGVHLTERRTLINIHPSTHPHPPLI